MKNRLIQSRFRGVYVGLAILWAAAVLALDIGADTWVGPAVTLSRIQGVESLIRSHSQDLLLNNHRGLRDQLLREGVITDDRNFDELHPGIPADQKKIHAILSNCHSVTQSAL